LGASLAQGHAHFLHCVRFYDGRWQTQVVNQIAVASFSHCANIEGKPPNFEELQDSRATPTFSSACDFMMGSADLSCLQNLKSLASAVAEIL